MNRKDKINLLEEISAGRKTIGELLPPIVRMWVQDETTSDLFHCEAEGLTQRKDERLPDKKNGQTIINVLVQKANCPLISESEIQ